MSVKLTYILDGKEIFPQDLKGKSGHLQIKVDYTNHEKKTVSIDGKSEEVFSPFVMLTGLILPTETFSNVMIDNGKVISDGNRNIVLGFTTMGIVAMNFLYVPMMPKLLGKLGLGGGMTVIAVILIIVAIITAICVKNNPEEAGEYPDGDPTYAVNGAGIAQMMKEYKSPFTIGKVLKDKNTWFIGLGSALAFLAVMSYIASAIPAMLAIGYAYTQASAIFAVGGIMGIVGSFIFGIIDQKIGTKKAFVAYFVFIIIGFVALLGMPKGLTFCWISGVVIFAAQGALCNLLPSYVASKYGRWDYTAGYQVIGTIFEIGAGIGVMMTGFFAGNIMGMYIFDIVVLVIGLIFMALSSDKFIGKR